MLSLIFFVVLIQQFMLSGEFSQQEGFKYLQKYGYFTSPKDGENITEQIQLDYALINFQDYYNLEVTGKLDNATLNMMVRARCGVQDAPSAFKIYGTRWIKSKLSWYLEFSQMQPKLRLVINKAFDVWASVTNLTFSYNPLKPDIIISIAKGNKHKKQARCMQGDCLYDFDNEGNVLAHAFQPNHDRCIEIHMDGSENWYFELGEVPEGKISFYVVLLHEIGHTLGLDHSQDEHSIMYAMYNEKNTKLTNDDIEGIRSLYGIKLEATVEAVTSPPPPPELTTEMTPKQTPKLDLCQISGIPTFLITTNHYMYIFYENLVWLVNLRDRKYRDPEKISDYLPYESFDHVYQQRNGNLLFVRKNLVTIFHYPDFTKKNGDEDRSTEILGVPKGKLINSIFATYTGNVIVLYDNDLYVEFNECSFQAGRRGTLYEKFPGIPTHVNHIFRYLDGNLYFFLNSTYYVFNEFENKVIGAGEFDLSLFGINCPKKGLLSQM